MPSARDPRVRFFCFAPLFSAHDPTATAKHRKTRRKTGRPQPRLIFPRFRILQRKRVSAVKKAIHLLTNRITLCLLVILAELGLLVFLFLRLHSLAGATVFLLLERLLTVILSCVVINRESNEYQAAWLFALWVLPAGWIFFLLFHGGKTKFSPHVAATQFPHYADPLLQKAATLLRSECGFYYADAQSVEYYPDGKLYFEALLIALRQAERFIFLEYYIIAVGKFWNTVLDILQERARHGVTVKVIYDDFGSGLSLPKQYAATLRQAGIEAFAFRPMRPVPDSSINHRNHRKICVIDGKIAFTGGINLADEYINRKPRFGYWKDIGLSFTGRAVYNCTALFLKDWAEYAAADLNDYPMTLTEGERVCIPFGDIPTDGHQVCRDLYLTLIHNATRSVFLYTPYFFPDGRIKTALRTAAKSGLDVRVCIPGVPDKKTAYELTKGFSAALQKDGVKIYRYLPGFLHAKLLIADEQYAVIGTSNMDFRSLYLHFENDVFLCGESVLPLVKDFKATLCDCELLGRERIGVLRRLYRSVLQVIAPLL